MLADAADDDAAALGLAPAADVAVIAVFVAVADDTFASPPPALVCQ